MMFFRLTKLQANEFYRVESNSCSLPASTATSVKDAVKSIRHTSLFDTIKIYIVNRETGDRRLVKTIDK
jgi:hypothetical protein